MLLRAWGRPRRRRGEERRECRAIEGGREGSKRTCGKKKRCRHGQGKDTNADEEALIMRWVGGRESCYVVGRRLREQHGGRSF